MTNWNLNIIHQIYLRLPGASSVPSKIIKKIAYIKDPKGTYRGSSKIIRREEIRGKNKDKILISVIYLMLMLLINQFWGHSDSLWNLGGSKIEDILIIITPNICNIYFLNWSYDDIV